MIKQRFTQNAGMTLVEATIVLAVASVIIAAVWMVSAVVYENARQYQANRQLQTIVQNVRQLYARVNALTNIADVTCTLDAQAAFPVEMRVAQGTPCSTTPALNHPWSSATAGTVRVFNRTSTTFGIVFSGLPKKACVGLATKLTGGDITNLTAVIINSGTPITGTSLPITIVTSNAACNVTSNTLEWQFDIRA
ncbi:MAG: type 4 pilus major pilin [Alphaproteobacteria bacterium]|nr:type 4 pilus major pilin [Alphaproteobacteria bacterium]